MADKYACTKPQIAIKGQHVNKLLNDAQALWGRRPALVSTLLVHYTRSAVTLLAAPTVGLKNKLN